MCKRVASISFFPGMLLFRGISSSASRLAFAFRGTPDLYVALHACGGLSDAVLSAALDKKSSFIVSGCCFCKYPALRESTLLNKLLMAVPAAKEGRVCQLCAPFVHMNQPYCCHYQNCEPKDVDRLQHGDKWGSASSCRAAPTCIQNRLCSEEECNTYVYKVGKQQPGAKDDKLLQNLLRYGRRECFCIPCGYRNRALRESAV